MKFKLFDEVQVKNESNDPFLINKKGIAVNYYPKNNGTHSFPDDYYVIRFISAYGESVDFQINENDLIAV